MYNYILLFIQGILTFASPCILPMLPIYFLYLTAGSTYERKQKQLILNTLAFVAGFTTLFLILGAGTSKIGSLFYSYKKNIDIFLAIFIIILALNFIFPFHIQERLSLLISAFKKRCFSHSAVESVNKATNSDEKGEKKAGIISSYFFGISFCTSWTACLSTSLSYALSLAANNTTVTSGLSLLFVFSMGLGIPFILSAIFFYKIQKYISLLKKYMRILQIFSGILMLLVGITMLTGHFYDYLSLFS